MEEDYEWEDDPQITNYEERSRRRHIMFQNNPKRRSDLFGFWSRAPQNSTRGGRLMTDRIARLLDMPHSTVVDAAASYQVSQRFITENTGDLFYDKLPLVVSEEHFTRRQIVDKIKEPLSNSRAVMPYSESSTLISGDYRHSPVLIWVNFSISGRTRRRDING